MRALRILADALLTVAAVVGVLGFALFVAVRLGAVQPLVVTSGSMRPTYETGDLVVSRPVAADTLTVGDVATLRSADDRLITHRVVSVTPAAQSSSEGVVAVQMQGDANDAADPQPYVVRTALVPVVTVPGVGPLVATAQRPAVAVPALVAVAALVAIAFVPSGHPPTPAVDQGPDLARRRPARAGGDSPAQ
ncbi:signal peptidase I [Cellulomonas sp. P5_C5]